MIMIYSGVYDYDILGVYDYDIYDYDIPGMWLWDIWETSRGGGGTMMHP